MKEDPDPIKGEGSQKGMQAGTLPGRRPLKSEGSMLEGLERMGREAVGVRLGLGAKVSVCKQTPARS